MRIIAGRARGLRLMAPAGLDVRPTADRIKESLFNILGGRLMDACVLDLFSGSGSLGLEAWSRGAARVVCLDNSTVSLRCIAKNVEKARAGGQITIYHGDAPKSLAVLYKKSGKFDIIFCDPPYEKGWCKVIVSQLKKYNVLQKDGILVLEHSVKEEIFLPEGISLLRREKYGETAISFIAANN